MKATDGSHTTSHLKDSEDREKYENCFRKFLNASRKVHAARNRRCWGRGTWDYNPLLASAGVPDS